MWTTTDVWRFISVWFGGKYIHILEARVVDKLEYMHNSICPWTQYV